MIATPAVVGPWARDKLDALGRYLDFYTKALKNQRWQTLYVDAYAGGGRATVRTPARAPAEGQLRLLEPDQADADEAELINGSPRVALSIPNPFAEYVLIEPDLKRLAELSALKAEFTPDRLIEVRAETAREGLSWLLNQPKSKRTHRGVVFLDPFGADLDWATIQALGESGYLEVLVNFSLHMGVQRMLPNSGAVPSDWADRLDRYFDTPAWRAEVYVQSSDDLFGSSGITKRTDYHLRLLELYRARLKQAFGHVSAPKLIRNTRCAPLYYLLWAGPHALGLKGADYILRMGDAVPKISRSP